MNLCRKQPKICSYFVGTRLFKIENVSDYLSIIGKLYHMIPEQCVQTGLTASEYLSHE